MNHKNITSGTLVEGSVSSTDISSDEINQLKAQMQECREEPYALIGHVRICRGCIQ